MKTKNTLIKLVLVLLIVYRISFDDVCGFRFWANFLAVLRFLIHPNAPLVEEFMILAVSQQEYRVLAP